MALVENFALALLGFILTSFVLCVVLVSKFFEGGYVTIIVTCLVIGFCYLVRRHYSWVGRELRQRNRAMVPPLSDVALRDIPIHYEKKTAIIFISDKVTGMHCLQWILKHFPESFSNFVFIGVGQVDIKSFTGKRSLKRMTKEVDDRYFVSYCNQKKLAATSYADYGSDIVEHLFGVMSANTRKISKTHVFCQSNELSKRYVV